MFLYDAHQSLTPITELRSDGLWVDTLLPELPLTRVMAGGIRHEYYRPIKAGDVLVDGIAVTMGPGLAGSLLVFSMVAVFFAVPSLRRLR